MLMHEDLNSCALVRAFKSSGEAELTIKSEVRRVLNMQGHPWSCAASTPPPSPISEPLDDEPPMEICVVTALPAGAAASLVLTSAEYTPRTRCHVRHHLDTMRATLYWVRAIRFVIHHAYGPCGTGGLHRRHSCGESPLMGVYLHCVDAGKFTIGLITSGTEHNPDVKAICLDFERIVWHGKPFTHTFVPLPICPTLRHVTLTLWWSPRAARVVPHVPLPCIKVILKDRASSAAASPIAFKGYHTVHLFLARPHASHLSGTRNWLVPHDIVLTRDDANGTEKAAAAAAKTTRRPMGGLTPAAARVRHADDPPAGETTQPYVDEDAEKSGPGLSNFLIDDRDRAVAHLLFTDATVSQTGEHLVGVEVTVEEAYKAMVPVLCTHLSPFLVVRDMNA